MQSSGVRITLIKRFVDHAIHADEHLDSGHGVSLVRVWLMRIALCLVISAGVLSGCSSSEPEVVETICEEVSTEIGQMKTIYDDGTSEYVRDEAGNIVNCWLEHE